MKTIKTFLIFCFLLSVSCSHSPRRNLSSESIAEDRKSDSLQVIAPQVLHFWSQLGPQNTISFRLVALGTECPTINIDGQESKMDVRFIKSTDPENQVICEAVASVLVRSAAASGVQFPVLGGSLERVVALGDTGCRMKSIRMQNCKNPDEWPLEKISMAASKLKPQLWIHTGDYSYREIECPRGDERCEGLSTGPNWKTWEEDVLKPMKSLLSSSPVILARGNHESCGGFGDVWFQFFGPLSAREKGLDCTPASATMLHDVGSIRFLNIDAASEGNLRREIGEYSVPQEDKFLWLISHRPFLGESPDVDYKKSAKLGEVLRSPGRVQLVFAGHTHLGSFISFNDERPPELVLGNGGVLIETLLQRSPKTDQMQSSYTFKDYGFALLEKGQENSWNLLMLDKNGKSRIRCETKFSLTAKTELQCK